MSKSTQASEAPKYVIDINGEVIEADTPLFWKKEASRILDSLNLTEQNFNTALVTIETYVLGISPCHATVDIARGKKGSIGYINLYPGVRPDPGPDKVFVFRDVVFPVIHGSEQKRMELILTIVVDSTKAKYFEPVIAARFDGGLISEKIIRPENAFILAANQIGRLPGFRSCYLERTSHIETLEFRNE